MKMQVELLFEISTDAEVIEA